MPQRLLVAVRVDATQAIGWGHLKRCLALAAALRRQGARLHWVGHSDSPAVAAMVRAEGHECTELDGDLNSSEHSPERDAHACSRVWAGKQPRLVLVDHYRLDARWHRTLRGATGARIVVIDDLADRLLAPDMLIDHNPAADRIAKYLRVLPAGTPVCGGPEFALLGPAYTSHARAVIRERPRRIGLVMGATDPAGHSPWVLRVLRERVGWRDEVRIASTSGNAGLAVLRVAVQIDGAAELLLDAPNLADFYTGLDVAIVAGGGALWECCCLGVPTVALMTVDNHRQSVPLVAAAGAVIGLDATGQRHEQAQALGLALRRLLDHRGEREALQRRAMAMVDGQGAERVAKRMLALRSVSSSSVTHALPNQGLRLAPATMADADRLLAWRNDPQTRAASHHGGQVNSVDHRAWLQRALKNPDRQLWLAWLGDQAIGTVRADRAPSTVRADRAGDTARTTLSWTIAPDWRGRGLGGAMLRLAVAHCPGPLHAEVKADNLASARMAEAAGLVLDSEVSGTLHFRSPGTGSL